MYVSCYYMFFAGLTICGVDCLLSAEWKSPNKIIARTGQAKGTGDIIVVTRSGGVGTTTVQFRGYNIQIGEIINLTFVAVACDGFCFQEPGWVSVSQKNSVFSVTFGF